MSNRAKTSFFKTWLFVGLSIVLAAAFYGCSSGKNTSNNQGVIGDSGGVPTTGQTGTGGTAAPSGGSTGGSGGAIVNPVDSGAGTGGGVSGSGGTGGAAADSGVAADAGDAGTADAGSGDPDFDKCMAGLKACKTSEMSTAAAMETPCSSLEFIPIPLTNGSNYGPVTVPPGPYGAQTMWNQGAGTEFVTQVNIGEAVCVPIGIETFAQPASVNAEIENLRDIDWSLYTIFRPACMKKGEKYPVITWANGTCGETHGYAPLLGAIAGHGYVVFASNSTWTGTAPTDTVQLRALDYAKYLNEDSTSVLYQKLDMDHIGAAGHSQGAMATANADDDPRIKAVIFYNTGTSNVKPFIDVSGDQDVGNPTLASIKSATESATQPGAWIYYHQILATGGQNTGHLVLMEQPDRVIDWSVAWWDWQLKGDEEAKKMFVGPNCGLCGHADQYEYGTNSLLK